MGKKKRKRKVATSARGDSPSPERGQVQNAVPPEGGRAEQWIRAALAALMFVVVLAMYPRTIDATGPIKTLILSWGAFLAASALLVICLVNHRPFQRPGILFAFVAGFFVLNTSAWFFSEYRGHGFIEVRRYVTLFLLCLTASQVYRTPAQAARFMTVVCVAVLLSTLYAFCQRLGWDPFPWADSQGALYKELPGTFGNPNYAVHTLIPCIIMVGYLAARKSRWGNRRAHEKHEGQPFMTRSGSPEEDEMSRNVEEASSLFTPVAHLTRQDAASTKMALSSVRSGTSKQTRLPTSEGTPLAAQAPLPVKGIASVPFFSFLFSRGGWYLAFLPFFLAHVAFTGQRAGKVGIFAAGLLLLVAWAVSKRMRRPVPRILTTLGTWLILSVLAALAISALIKVHTGSYLPLDWSLRLRYNAYDSSARMILDRPLLGWGPGNYVIQNTPYWTGFEQEWFATRRKLNEHVHCDLLESGADAGMPGMALYVAIFVAGIVQGLHLAFSGKTRDHRCLGYASAAFFCAFFVDGLFGFNIKVPVSAALLFIMAGILDSLTRSSHDREESASLPAAAVAWRLAAVGVALLLSVMDTRVFGSELAMYRGRSAMVQRAFDVADARLAEGERLCPSNWILTHQRARASMQGGHPEEAATHFQQALDKNPNYVVTLIGLARTKLNLALAVPADEPARQAGLLDEVQHYAERASALCPVMGEADDLLGRAASVRAVGLQQRAQKDESLREPLAALWREAEARLTKALETESENRCQLLCMLAQARIGLRDGAGAEEAFVDAVLDTPQSKDAWAAFFRFARAFARPYAFQELAQDAVDAELASEDPDTGLIAALALHMAQLEQSTFKEPEAIEAAYALAVRYAPNQAETWSAFALFSKQARRSDAFKEAALDAWKHAHAAGKAALPAVEAACKAWQGEGALAGATGDLMRAIKAYPGPKDVQTLRVEFGWAAEVLLAEIERAGTGLENRGVALLNLGTILMSLGNPKLAEVILAAALPSLPERQKDLCIRYRAEVLSHLNRHAEAIQLLHCVAARNAGDLPTRLAYARALGRAGKAAQARREYETLLASPALSPQSRPAIQKELRALKGG